MNIIGEDIIKKIRELNFLKDQISNIDTTDQIGISQNAILSLEIIDEIWEMVPNNKLRELIYSYVTYLDNEDFIKCHQVLEKINKIIDKNG